MINFDDLPNWSTFWDSEHLAVNGRKFVSSGVNSNSCT